MWLFIHAGIKDLAHNQNKTQLKGKKWASFLGYTVINNMSHSLSNHQTEAIIELFVATKNAHGHWNGSVFILIKFVTVCTGSCQNVQCSQW